MKTKYKFRGLNKKIEGTILTPIDYSARRTPSRNAYYLFHCDCGKNKELILSDIVYGKTKSCGCIRKKRSARILYLKKNHKGVK